MVNTSQTITRDNERNDREILDHCLFRIANADLKALEELYRRTSASVYAYALSLLQNAHDAQDVTHDCYLSIYASAKYYQTQHKPLAWILTIVRNDCFQKQNSRKRTVELAEEEWGHLAIEDTALSTEDRLLLQECLCHLSEEERQIVVLHAVSGFRYREIGELLELPLATVLSKYHRAMQKLRKFIKKGEET